MLTNFRPNEELFKAPRQALPQLPLETIGVARDLITYLYEGRRSGAAQRPVNPCRSVGIIKVPVRRQSSILLQLHFLENIDFSRRRIDASEHKLTLEIARTTTTTL
jgi:hypothetical protein